MPGRGTLRSRRLWRIGEWMPFFRTVDSSWRKKSFTKERLWFAAWQFSFWYWNGREGGGQFKKNHPVPIKCTLYPYHCCQNLRYCVCLTDLCNEGWEQAGSTTEPQTTEQGFLPCVFIVDSSWSDELMKCLPCRRAVLPLRNIMCLLYFSSILFAGPTDSPSDGLQVQTSKGLISKTTSKGLILSRACAL